MGWGRKSNAARVVETEWTPPVIEQAVVDWDRLVTLDFETYFDDDYTLKKLSTSEYVRDARFQAQMVGIKVGSKPTRIYTGKGIATALKSIPWATHSVLCHHAQFDAFILNERFDVRPKFIYDTLSMGRALFSNDIGASLDELSQFLGGTGKVDGGSLALTKGVRKWSKELIARVSVYCAGDVDATLDMFQKMHQAFPADEIEMIDMVCRMFTEPVLGVDRERVKKELAREIEEKKQALLSFVKDADAAGIHLSRSEIAKVTTAEAEVADLVVATTEQVTLQLTGEPSKEAIDVKRVKKLIGSAKFAELLKAALGCQPPMKISPAWLKTPKEERDDAKKWTWAFSKTDLKFLELKEHRNPRVRALVEARLAVKSTTNETRAGRFLTASENGAKLPVYLKYSAAHTHRLGGGNKMNMQNLKRGGELRKSIKAPPGHMLCVKDSGQIEARVNGWLWGQDDLLEDFRKADLKLDRDAYCKFADLIYKREITKADEIERFVGKTCILGLGYQMGPARLQKTLALGASGPQVFLSEEQCIEIVGTYRRKNHRIKAGWNICQQIIRDMAEGTPGSYKCISWDKETIYLPNGMTMHYPGLKDENISKRVTQALVPELFDPEEDLSREAFVYRRKDVEVKIYGGLLCENIVQALARIIVLGQTLNIHRKGHRIVMSTHDECVAAVKKAMAAKVDAFMQQVMMTPPAWASDLPLNADGGYDVIYSK